jgi:hypothetical protein
VPDSALGPRGRTVRCARCGRKWHADRSSRLAAAPAASPVAPVAPVAKPAARDTLADHMLAETMFGDVNLAAPDDDEIAMESPGPQVATFDDLDFDAEDGQPSGDGDDGDDPFSKISDLLMSHQPEPIPDVFSEPPPRPAPRRKGAAVLWLVLIVLLLALSGSALYFFQDRLIDRWPQLAHTYVKLGVRNEVVGAGLAFRDYSSERVVEDNDEVLIVRGVIANTADQSREIPLLRLALYNNQTLLQEKIISPPQTMLDGHATVGFRVTLDQPDASATRFEVTFAAAKPPEKPSGMKPPGK